MTTTLKPSRADLIRQRRTSKKPAQPVAPRSSSTARQVYRPETVYRPAVPRPVSRPRSNKFSTTAQTGMLERVLPSSGTVRQSPGNPSGRYSRNPRRTGYDYSFNLGRTGVRAPALSIPQWGSRWVSLLLSVLLTFLLYTLWTSSIFTVAGAEVRGNQRLSAADISAVLGMAGEPIFKAVPAALQNNLRTTFPDLASVRVSVGFPNHLTITVVERTPVLAWYQNGGVTWIDGNGVSFMPRGNLEGLIQVAANGTPPKIPAEPGQPLYDQSFIHPEMVKAMVTLSPYVPAGAPMVYDPQYGMGWQDSHGWSVYFGQNTQDIPMKLVVYQAIVSTFTQDGIHPSMVSMEYLDAPFYK